MKINKLINSRNKMNKLPEINSKQRIRTFKFWQTFKPANNKYKTINNSKTI